MNKQAGFTLLEIMFVVVLVGFLGIIAVAAMGPMWENARHKEAVRNVTSALRDARSQTISRNLEHRVYFNLGTGEYWLERGNQSSGSTNWPNRVFDYETFSGGILMAAGDGDPTVAGDLVCSVVTGTKYFEFNPNGTAESDIGDSAHICILDNNNTSLFATGLRSNTTGRVKIWRGNGALAWKD